MSSADCHIMIDTRTGDVCLANKAALSMRYCRRVGKQTFTAYLTCIGSLSVLSIHSQHTKAMTAAYGIFPARRPSSAQQRGKACQLSSFACLDTLAPP
jgi:hypothetical protein